MPLILYEWLHFGSIKESILADSVKLHVLYRRKQTP